MVSKKISFEKMDEMLSSDLIINIEIHLKHLIEREIAQRNMNAVITMMNKMNCNKRIRNNIINERLSYNPRVHILYRRMFFNHYGLFHMA